MAVEIECEVNGRPRKFEVESDTSLLLALRHELELRGTRHGCGMGTCGACTVLLDGRAINACNTPAEAATGLSIQTIEGFADDPLGKTLVNAFIHEQAGQCGYCLAGILMKSKALLAKRAVPTRVEIAEALDDHLCRCGAHQRILDAVECAAAELNKEQAV